MTGVAVLNSPESLFLGRNGLNQTRRPGSIRGKTAECLAQSFRAEKNPVVVVPRIESLFNLSHGVENCRQVLLVHDRDKGCARGSVRVRGRKGGRRYRRDSHVGGIVTDSCRGGIEGVQIVAPELVRMPKGEDHKV